MKSIEISFPTDEGFFGRQCNSQKCGKYFRINSGQIRDEMHCPYCGEKFSNDELWTNEQNEYITNVLKKEGLRLAQKELDKTFAQLARNNKNITFQKTNRHLLRNPEPKKEKKVDCEIKCPECSTEFQVYGVFGYCPICKDENMMIYDANMKIIEQEIKSSNNPNRALRHAYKDLVSTFEFYCKSVALKYNIKQTNFQDIRSTRKVFKNSNFKIDIYQEITEKEKIEVKRIFQKRHAYEHHNGIISERYVKEIPEDNRLIGQLASLSYLEFESGTKIIRKLLTPIIDLRSNV